MSFYALTTDEVGGAATITLPTGTADANYPVTNVGNKNPADIFLTSSTGTDVDILWDHGGATDVQLFSLHHHNIPAGTDVRIQRNAADSWGAPSMDVAVVIGTFPITGIPPAVAIDMTAQAGYGSYRYTRLHIPSLAQKIGVGSAMLWGTKRTGLAALFPARVTERIPTRKWGTAMGVYSRYNLGVRIRELRGRVANASAAEISAWLALWRAARGDANQFFYWLDPTGADGWLASFAEDAHDLEYQLTTLAFAEFSIEEVPYGLAIPTS